MSEQQSTPGCGDSLQRLIELHGPGKVAEVVAKLLGGIPPRPRELPAELFRIVSRQALEDTVNQLDASVDDLLTKGQAREAAYEGKGDLVKKRTRLETEIQLAEASAFMSHVSADGKTGTLPNGQAFPLNNDTNRDVFRRLHSGDLRKELAGVEGDLQALEVGAMQKRDGYEMAVQASESVRAKAQVQARLLQFLAGGI